MRSDENSKLISDLYGAESRQEISDILEYMGESGNSIFVYPILDGYKKYKYSSLGYYFIWNLSRLDYPDLGERLNELLESYEIQKEHIPMALFFMSERRFFSNIANRMVVMHLEHYLDAEFRADFGLNSLGLSCVLNYAYKADILARFEKKLRELIFSDVLDEGEKAVAMSYLLESNQEKQIDFLIENYFDKIQKTNLEKNLARKLLFCKADNVRELRKIVIENGDDATAAFLSKQGAISFKKRKKDIEGGIVYDCVDVVIKISIIREQINKKTLFNEQFGFSIFPLNDLLVHQSQCVDDKSIFMSMCTDLLQITRTVSFAVRKHGLNEKEAEKFLKGMPDDKKNLELAHLFLYLNSKKVGVDYDFFGLRQLDRTIELLLEDRGDQEFFGKLENIGILKMYYQGQWHKIHSYLLNSYLQSLETMNKTFNQFVKQDLED
ncbi:MAG: hypothetical protein WC178_02090 [Candidatus Paceibacterota bacterium]